MPSNAPVDAFVAVRPMQRADVDALAAWGRHDDPLYEHYNVPWLTPASADELWTFLSSAPGVRRPFAGLVGEQLVASLVVRNMDAGAASGELGIMLDPAWIGRGFGRRILQALVAVLGAEGFRRLHLEVAGFNGRAIAAYRGAGFYVVDDAWGEPEPGCDIASLLAGPAAGAVRPYVRLERDGRYLTRIIRMERRLIPIPKDELPLAEGQVQSSEQSEHPSL